MYDVAHTQMYDAAHTHTHTHTHTCMMLRHSLVPECCLALWHAAQLHLRREVEGAAQQYIGTLVQQYSITSVHRHISAAVQQYIGTTVHWYSSAAVHSAAVQQ